MTTLQLQKDAVKLSWNASNVISVFSLNQSSSQCFLFLACSSSRVCNFTGSQEFLCLDHD